MSSPFRHSEAGCICAQQRIWYDALTGGTDALLQGAGARKQINPAGMRGLYAVFAVFNSAQHDFP